jgi:hypothetical protein
MIQIRKEVDDIISGKQPKDSNLLKNAPHPVALMTLPENEWNRPYTKDQAAYPLPNLRKNKFWPTVTRIDDGTSRTLDDRYILLTLSHSLRRHPSHLLLRFRRGLRRHRRRGTQDLGRCSIQHVVPVVRKDIVQQQFSDSVSAYNPQFFSLIRFAQRTLIITTRLNAPRPCASTAVVFITS